MEDVDRGANRLMQDHWLENIRPLKCGEVVFHSHGCILNVIRQYECDSPPALFFRELFSEGAQTPKYILDERCLLDVESRSCALSVVLVTRRVERSCCGVGR